MSIDKRDKIEAKIQDLIVSRLSKLATLPLIKTTPSICHQAITADGILTISEQTLQNVSLEAVYGFCFNYYAEYTNVYSDIKGSFISQLDSRRSFWQQVIKTPFFMANV
jgi:hypothetical protein